MKITEVPKRIKESGLRVTPQRVATLEAIITLGNHPTADNIIEYIHKSQPGISVATVYNVLEVLAEKELIQRVKTDRDVMRYDAVAANHHHLYCAESDRIDDYIDEDLNQMLDDYFSSKRIPGFTMEDIRVHIGGRFNGGGKQL